MNPGPQIQWTVVVPLKATDRGKSRIALPSALRQAVAIAMALDTVSAAAAAANVLQVLVVAERSDDAARMQEIPQVRAQLTTAITLNGALAEASGDVSGPIAVLPADLPNLTADDVEATLTAAGQALVGSPMAAVADRHGVGTTMLAARSAADLQVHYGGASAQRHARAGAVLLDRDFDDPIRQDVDTVDELLAATGPRTVAVLTNAGVVSSSEVRVGEAR